MSGGWAALVGAGYGAVIGALFAVLFGIFFDGPNFGGLLLYSVANGVIFGACSPGCTTCSRATGAATSCPT